MDIHIFNDANDLSEGLATWVCNAISNTLKKQDRFSIALSGGSTPKQLHKLLAASPYKEEVDWSKLHIFWGDERDVPFIDEQNNAKMAFDTLLNFVPVPKDQIHIMHTDIPPDRSACDYEKLLRGYFNEPSEAWPEKSFDLVLLGMGNDGHTLSLFPGSAMIHEEKAWVKSFYLKEQQMFRITLTKNIVNLSSRIVFMISGAAKSHALYEVLKGSSNPDLYPSQVIKPVNGSLDFFVDRAAYAELETVKSTV